MKVAIAFWGITRSLKYTLESIKEKIFKPLKEADIDYDIFMHTYKKEGVYSNIWAKEENIVLDNDEWRLLEPTFIEIENDPPAPFQHGLKFEDYHTHPDFWGGRNYETLNNMIKALWSKQRVARMVAAIRGYEFVIFVRPDCKYYTPFDVEWLYGGEVISIPNFDCFPISDRFMVLPVSKIELVTTCFDKLLEYSRRQKVHSETYLSHLLRDINCVKYKVPFHFNRIRADGTEFYDWQRYFKREDLIKQITEAEDYDGHYVTDRELDKLNPYQLQENPPVDLTTP